MAHRPHFDAGHGGTDSGAIGVVHEEDANLAISLKCFSAAKRQGWSPTQTRSTDQTIVLASRAKKANASGATEFISIHSDWRGGKGLGMVAITPNNHDKKQSWRMADFILDELTPMTTYKDAGAYTDRRGLAVLRGTNMPACIVEVMSVADAVLRSDKFRTEVAENIIRGLCEFYGTEYVPVGMEPKPNPKPAPKLPLRERGDRGQWVKVIQRAVGADDDGIFGENTERKVKSFQRKHHLSDDGIVGRDTWRIIASVSKEV